MHGETVKRKRYLISFPREKRPGRDIYHAHPSSAEVKEVVKLNLYSSAGPSWTVVGRIVILPFTDHAVVVQGQHLLNCRVTALVYSVLEQTPLLEFENLSWFSQNCGTSL